MTQIFSLCILAVARLRVSFGSGTRPLKNHNGSHEAMEPFGFWACQIHPGPLHSGPCWPSDHPRGSLMLLVLSVGPPCLELFFAFCVPHHTFKILRSLKSLKLVICTLKTCHYGAADVMFTCRCCVDIYRMWAGFGGGGCGEGAVGGGALIFASKVTEVSPQLCISTCKEGLWWVFLGVYC